MQRAYDVRAAALTVRVPVKWIDNLLCQHALPGVHRTRQGVQRRITEDGLLVIELVRILNRDLEIPVRQAVLIATTAIAERDGSRMRAITASGITILFPVAEIETRLRERVMDAVESVGRVRRGRPRRHQRQEKTPDA